MPERALLLGIEIGGTKLQLGLGRGDGRILDLKRLGVEPAAGADRIRRQIVAAVEPWLVSERVAVAAVGIGFGGPVDAARGRVTRSFQVPGWEGFPLADWTRETLGVPLVSVHNDADTAALGEARFGAGIGLSPVLYVNSGSGIGGGLIVDGRIYRGAGAGAVEIGHLVLADPDAVAPERTLATLEQIASGWAIGAAGRAWAEREQRDGWEGDRLLHLAGGDPRKVTAEVVAASARRCPYGIGAGILARAARALGFALAQAVTLLAPRRVILGGGVSQLDEDLWIEPIRRTLDQYVFAPFRGGFDVVTARLGEEVVVHGALALAADAVAESPAAEAFRVPGA